MRGLCIRCYEREYLAGRLDLHPKMHQRGMCTRENCAHGALSKGLCKTHYEAARLIANPVAAAHYRARRAARHRERYHTEPAYRDRLLGYDRTDKGRQVAKSYAARRRSTYPLQVWAQTAAASLRKKGCAGATADQLLCAYEAQRMRCAVCAVDMVPKDPQTRPCADHCAKSRKFRALLCFKCNVMVANHEAERLDAGAAYVRAHKANCE